MAQRPNTFTLNMSHPLATGLVFAGLGALPGSTRYHDSSVFGNTGTLTNMTSSDWVFDSTLNRMGVSGNASNKYVAFGATPLLDSLPGITVSLWAKQATIRDYNVFLAKGTYTNGFDLYCESDPGTYRQLHWAMKTSAFADWYISKQLDAAVLYHFCVTYPGTGTPSIYVNGVSYTATLNTGSVGGSVVSSGDFRLLTDAGNYTNGSVFDPLVYWRALGTSEVQQLADPSNVMLSGLINYPRRKWWPVAGVGTPATFKAAWAARRRQVIGGGIS